MSIIRNTRSEEQNEVSIRKKEVMMNSNPTFSFFRRPIQNLNPCAIWTLEDAWRYITSFEAAEVTKQLRSLTNKDDQRKFKSTHFDYVTFSGTFRKRGKKQLIQHSGLICLDFDNIADVEDLFARLLQDKCFCTRLLVRSPSGNGLKWVIQLNSSDTAEHEEYFESLLDYCTQTYGITPDEQCKDIGRACFLAYDPKAYLGKALQPKPAKKKSSSKQSHSSDKLDDVERLTQAIERKRIDITADYARWRNIGFALASGLGENGRDYFHRLSQFYPQYREKDTDAQYDKCMRAKGTGITLASLFQYAKEDAGIIISPIYANGGMTELAERTITDEETTPTFWKQVHRKLPHVIEEIASCANSAEDADVLILGTIVTLSSCLPNIYGIYGDRVVYPNLFLFVTAPASAGKGRLTLCRKLVQPIQEKLQPKKLIIPANSSATMIYQILAENDGRGLMFETEGDTLANVFASDYGNYSDGFRKAFHHEPISYMRRKGNEQVELLQPKLSTVLSGTPRQIASLIPDTENGLFSRFIFYYVDFKLTWLNVFASSTEESIDDIFDSIGNRILDLYQNLNNNEEVRFSLTSRQKEAFNAYFQDAQLYYHSKLGDDFIASVRRMGLITYRIAMVLSIIRMIDEDDFPALLYCHDGDFECAITISKVLLQHTERVYTELSNHDLSRPAGQGQNRRTQLLELLPDEFGTATAQELAAKLSIPRRTVERYLAEWHKEGTLTKIAFGQYSKTNSTLNRYEPIQH